MSRSCLKYVPVICAKKYSKTSLVLPWGVRYFTGGSSSPTVWQNVPTSSLWMLEATDQSFFVCSLCLPQNLANIPTPCLCETMISAITSERGYLLLIFMHLAYFPYHNDFPFQQRACKYSISLLSWLGSIPLCICMFYLSILWWILGWFFFVRLLSIVLKQTQEYNYHFGILIVHTPVVGQLDYKLALFLIFLRDSHIAFHNGFSLHFYP